MLGSALSVAALLLPATAAPPHGLRPPGREDAAPPAGEPRPLTFLAGPRCDREVGGGEVLVCGRRRDLYRLPLPRERDPVPGPVRGDSATGNAALTPPGRCGIFAGERRCGTREAAGYGYGEGRDPLTVLRRLARKAADPDAD